MEKTVYDKIFTVTNSRKRLSDETREIMKMLKVIALVSGIVY